MFFKNQRQKLKDLMWNVFLKYLSWISMLLIYDHFHNLWRWGDHSKGEFSIHFSGQAPTDSFPDAGEGNLDVFIS